MEQMEVKVEDWDAGNIVELRKRFRIIEVQCPVLQSFWLDMCQELTQGKRGNAFKIYDK